MISKNSTYLLILLLLYACGNSNKNTKDKSKANAPVSIDVSVAKLENFTNTIEANGTVLANEFVELRPEANGRIVLLNIQEGKQVAEGTLLVKLYDDDLQAQLKKYEAQLQIALSTEKRLKSLLTLNGLNQQEYDLALNQVNNVRADIDFTKAQIRKTEIRAPFTGTIGLRSVSKGAYVTQSNIIATLQQTNTLKIDFVLPENYAAIVKTGDEVNVISGSSKEPLRAKIIATEPQINTATRNIKVRAVLSGDGAKLNPGAFVKITIDNGKGKPAILVPSNCIIPDTRNKKIVLIKGGKAKFTIIETGFRNEEKVEILSGMEQGDTFAIKGILFLKPDVLVKIKNVKS